MDHLAGIAKTCITATERTRHRVQGLCIYRRGILHFAANCPLAKARPIGKRRAITAVSATGSASGRSVITAMDSKNNLDSDLEGKGGAEV